VFKQKARKGLLPIFEDWVLCACSTDGQKYRAITEDCPCINLVTRWLEAGSTSGRDGAVEKARDRGNVIPTE